jgi:beta-lactamase superfamily II metal-dependent hydrolase
MYEIEFLPVGDGARSGDAIALRFTRPDTGDYAHVIIDAGFQDDGAALVDHVQTYYETDSIDLAILTHPDGDHIGGMGQVIRDLNVATLCVHRLGDRGGAGLRAAGAVADLIEVAEGHGTQIAEPFAGGYAFGGALTFLGPDEAWYGELVAQQQEEEAAKAAQRAPSRLVEAATNLGQRFLAALPVEVPFDDKGGTSPRNNTSLITMLEVDGYRALLTGDAGVPALERAWNWLGANGRDTRAPDFIQIAHHGSRRNASSATLDRLLGPTGQSQTRSAFVSVVDESPDHPSPRVINAYMRRGYRTCRPNGNTIRHMSPDAPARVGWGPLTPMDPMDESGEE